MLTAHTTAVSVAMFNVSDITLATHIGVAAFTCTFEFDSRSRKYTKVEPPTVVAHPELVGSHGLRGHGLDIYDSRS